MLFFIQNPCICQKKVVPLRRKRKTGGFFMTALQLNADIYRNLGIIAEDESMLKRVAKYVQKLAKQMTDRAGGVRFTSSRKRRAESVLKSSKSNRGT